MNRIAILALLLAMGGCTKQLYSWGGYNSYLYSYYQDPSSVEMFLTSMESHIQQVEASGGKPAPGLYAEVGTLYLQKGDQNTALAFYTKEKDTWPESGQLMDALMANLTQSTNKE